MTQRVAGRCSTKLNKLKQPIPESSWNGLNDTWKSWIDPNLGRARRSSLGNEAIVGRGVDGAVHGGEAEELGGGSLDERD